MFRKVLSNIFLVFFGICLAFTIPEIGLRMLQRYADSFSKLINEDGSLYQYDEKLGWKYVPGYRGIETSRDWSYKIQINKKGFGDREYEYAKPTGRKRIVVLGDSFTFGVGVDQDQAFPKVLERLLENTDVLNLGISAYSTDQELLLLQQDGVKYHPDLAVVAVSVVNDADDNLLPYPREAERPKPYFSLRNGQLILQNVPVPHTKKARPKLIALRFLMVHYHELLDRSLVICLLCVFWVDV